MSAGADARAAAAANLAVDATTIEVVGALRAAGVEPILLKGASLAQRLYDEPAERRYVDCDLIVAPSDLSVAEGELARLGFSPALPEEMTAEWQRHAREWSREREAVDLHRTLMGAHAPPEAVWAALSEHTVPLRLGAVEVATPDPTATALHVALHAAQHGREERRPLRDLELALARLERDTWAAAAVLAASLDAQSAFAAGLRLRPDGDRLAEALGLAAGGSTVETLHAASAPGGALAMERLAQAPGPRARAALLARAAFPPPAHLRYFHPLARRGRLGLAAVYALRPFDLARKTPGAWRAWRSARRDASD